MRISDMSYETIKLFGGTVVATTPSASSLNGTLFVVCDRHPEQKIPINCSPLWSDGSVLDAAQNALKLCINCVEEHEHKMSWKNTRWPNAGMPGGAEL